MKTMSEKDANVIAAMRRYDAATVGSPDRDAAGQALDRIAAALSDRDRARIKFVYQQP